MSDSNGSNNLSDIYSNNNIVNSHKKNNDCDCIVIIERYIKKMKEDARKKEIEYSQNLDKLKDSIIEGSEERIARMLLKAAAYHFSLEKDLTVDLNSEEIINSLINGIHIQMQKYENKTYDILLKFITNNSKKILEQQQYFNGEEMLKKIVSNKVKAKGLLQSNFEREIKNADSSLERTEKLKIQLEAWKGNARLQNKIRYIKICDIHN